MRSRMFGKRLATFVVAAACVGWIGVGPASAGDTQKRKSSDVATITVTLEGASAPIDARDFSVFRGDARQEIVEVKGPGEAPVNLAVLIQDGVDVGVGHEVETIREFIKGLPAGSRVMVGYLLGTHFQMRQEFTGDLGAAAEAVRLPITSAGAVS